VVECVTPAWYDVVMQTTLDLPDEPAMRAAVFLMHAFGAVNEIPHDHRGDLCAQAQVEMAAAYRTICNGLIPVTPLV